MAETCSSRCLRDVDGTAEPVCVGGEARPGARVRLAVDPSGFHFFDPASSANLRRAGAPAETRPLQTQPA